MSAADFIKGKIGKAVDFIGDTIQKATEFKINVNLDKNFDPTAGYFKTVVEKIDQTFIDFISQSYNNIIQSWLPILVALLGVYLVYVFVKFSFNKILAKDLAYDFVIAIIFFIFISEWGNIYRYLVDPVVNGGEELIMQMTGIKASSFMSGYFTMIQAIVVKSIGSGTFNMTQLFDAMIYAGTYFLLMLGALINFIYFAFLVIQAKVIIIILMVLAPIFISLAMFEKTRPNAISWFKTIIEQYLTILILNLMVSFLFSICIVSLEDYSTTEIIGMNFSSSFLLIGVTVLLFLMMRKASGLATKLLNSGSNLLSKINIPFIG